MAPKARSGDSKEEKGGYIRPTLTREEVRVLRKVALNGGTPTSAEAETLRHLFARKIDPACVLKGW